MRYRREWINYWLVDEAIECITGLSEDAVRELLAVAMDCYSRDVPLYSVWPRLTPGTRAHIHACYEQDYGRIEV